MVRLGRCRPEAGTLGRQHVRRKAVVPAVPPAPRLWLLCLQVAPSAAGCVSRDAGSRPRPGLAAVGQLSSAPPHGSPRTDGKAALLAGSGLVPRGTRENRPYRRRPLLAVSEVETWGHSGEQLGAQQVVSVIFVPTRVCEIKGERYSNLNYISSPCQAHF